MQFQTLSSIVLLATAQLAAAAPMESANTSQVLKKRADPTGEYCGSEDGEQFEYDVSWVQDSFDNLQTYVNTPGDMRPSAGGRTYPQRFEGRDPEVAGQLDTIDGCETGQDGKVFWEFPLTQGWNGGPAESQGADRVIGIGASPGQGQPWELTYCLSVTHRGQEGGAFVPCTDI
ncbi:hypothetical protein F4808DRAFT_475186 [Astrocystis sublimbata]|nr:hypothetical protein F4808DRAFT_475186 [Astrocystis sublimbata]